MEDRLVTVKEAAALLGFDPRTIEDTRSQIRKSLLEAGAVVVIGRAVRIKTSGIRKVIDRGTKTAPARAPAAP